MKQITMKKMVLLVTIMFAGRVQMYASQDTMFGAIYEEEHKDLKRAREEYEKYVTKVTSVASGMFSQDIFNIDVDKKDELKLNKLIEGKFSLDQKKNMYRILRDIGSKVEQKASEYVNSRETDSTERKNAKEKIVEEAQKVLHQISFCSIEWLALIDLVKDVKQSWKELDVKSLDSALNENIDLLGMIGLNVDDKNVSNKFIDIITLNILEYSKLLSYLCSKESKSELNEYFAKLLFNKAIFMLTVKNSIEEPISLDASKCSQDCIVKENSLKVYASIDIKRKYELLRMFHETVINREEKRTSWIELASNVAIPSLVIAAIYGFAVNQGHIDKNTHLGFMYKKFEDTFKVKQPVIS